MRGVLTAVVLALLLAAGPAGAQTAGKLVGNMNVGGSDYAATDVDQAQAFTTGGNAPGYKGYKLTKVQLQLTTSGSNLTYAVTIREASGANPSDTVVGTLTNPAPLPSGASTVVDFTAPDDGIDLDAGTTYFLVWDISARSTPRADEDPFMTTSSDAEDADSATGWSIANTGLWKDFEATVWRTDPNSRQITLHGYAKRGPLVSNTGQTTSSSAAIGFDGSNNWERATLFTTGPSTGGYTLSGVDVSLAAVPTGASPKVSIWTTSGGNPEGSLHDLDNPSSVTANAVNTFTATSSPTLTANTTYAVVLQQTGTAGKYNVNLTASSDEDTDAAAGWSIADTRHSQDAAASNPTWATSSGPIKLAVKGVPVDTTPPTVASALVNGDKLTITFDDALWPVASLTNDAFAVTKTASDGTEPSVSLSTTAPSVSGSTVVLTLASAVGSSDAGFRVSYTKPTTVNRIFNAASIEAESFSRQNVARVLVSNVGQTQSSTSFAFDIWKRAQGFRTGSNSDGYVLSSVEVAFHTAPTASMEVQLVTGIPSATTPAVVRTLTPPATLSTGTLTFTAPANTTLSATTDYFVTVAGGSGAVSVTSSDNEDSEGASGWTVSDDRHDQNIASPGSWQSNSSALLIRVNGEAIGPPAVTGVAIASIPSRDVDNNGAPETYAHGEKIRVEATFSKAVTVDTSSGTPRLKIKMDPSYGEMWAEYESGGGSKVLTFAYTVVVGNLSPQGIAVLENTLELNGGTIKEATNASVNAVLSHTGLPHDSTHKVDGNLAPLPPPPPGGGGGGGGSSRPRDDHGNTAGRATRIQPGGRTVGQFHTTRDVDYFTLTAPHAGVAVVETTGSTATRGTVWQDGVEVASADSGGSGQNFRLSARVEAGPVVIAVRGTGRQTGRYTLQTALVVGHLENPRLASFQSGLGVISGWVCEAEGVTVEIEKADGTVVELAAAYGTERADTAGVCGDTDNGFGVLVNWNLLDDGDHAVRVLVDGVALGVRVVPGVGVVPAREDGIELGRAPVTVTTLGAEFVKGLTGSVLVEDFPQAGEQVRLVWQESQQNFVLAPAELGATVAPTPSSGAIEGVLENPAPASYQSGIGVISGWVCEAEAVVIEIDGQPIAAAAGTERADTLDRCGDVENGFGLLVNWAEFGAGAHEVVALVDGVELSRATVTVTLVDEMEPFVRGLTKRVELPDFPTPDETVTLEWQESQQNFVITGVD